MMYDDLVHRLLVCAEGYKYQYKWLSTMCKEAADAIEELSMRETPMRVRITTSTKRCPSCNKQLSGRGNIHRNYRFCRWCGQALDWAEPPKESEPDNV